MNIMSWDELMEHASSRPRHFEKWRVRGDGAAIYQNVDLSSPEMGDEKIVSYGSAEAQLEVKEPPSRLPDIGGQINHRYSLRAVVLLEERAQ